MIINHIIHFIYANKGKTIFTKILRSLNILAVILSKCYAIFLGVKLSFLYKYPEKLECSSIYIVAVIFSFLQTFFLQTKR